MSAKSLIPQQSGLVGITNPTSVVTINDCYTNINTIVLAYKQGFVKCIDSSK